MWFTRDVYCPPTSIQVRFMPRTGVGRLVAPATGPGVAGVDHPHPPATQEVVGAHGDHLAGEVRLVFPVTVGLARPYARLGFHELRRVGGYLAPELGHIVDDDRILYVQGEVQDEEGDLLRQCRVD